MKVCLVGEGAQGITHIKALQDMQDVEVVTLAGGVLADAEAFASDHGIEHVSTDLEECLDQPGVEAAVITSPNQVHCEQTVMALEKGKHVLLELPMGLSLAESQRVAAAEASSGKVAMMCHTQRFTPAFRKIHEDVRDGKLHLHHIVQQTYFFRRVNENRFGKPRIWTDDLLWHQACHMLDMVYWILGDPDMEAWGQCGPVHETLKVPMDVTIALKSRSGCLVSASQSFNNHGPIQGFYRFIGEEATYLSNKGGLTDHEGNDIEVSGPSGVEAQDGEFFAAIREGRTALTSCTEVLPVMALIDRVQRSMDGADGAPSTGMVERQ
ncbi:MAG: Gfo/Idh/MocA family oxidoreductase [Candidatus Latescibacteria bacterium]|mgnify:FL=1|jgi:2-hydroxy-4-carboxymuconate semialdehyde hemiacetal dehydrogenase|nr:oxidoreductase [Gemmatimonadaceae bacterium]MDP6015607.1 Gfo/Idh/MocA family oxidoreductase [Candidatus Latescibacterota bacterium]MDP7448422.1 Gfo/Idh/MocA family oxidoreductase [Candidatus Latescibacterota bacterium]HJP31192.1 Gfo/Idh/MocA family oxidoreductase [Candidatus Latescibacterota bacterium]